MWSFVEEQALVEEPGLACQASVDAGPAAACPYKQ